MTKKAEATAKATAAKAAAKAEAAKAAAAAAKAAERAAANAKIAAALSVTPGTKPAPESLDTKPTVPVDPLPTDVIEASRAAVQKMEKASDAEAAAAEDTDALGAILRRVYPTEADLLNVKKQYMADAILPFIKPKHKVAIERTLCRKGSEEWDAMSATDKAAWEVANKAKKDAKATLHTYFKRILRATYEVKKEAKETTLATTLAALAAQWIKRLEKAEGEDGLDIPAALAGFRAVAAACPTPKA